MNVSAICSYCIFIYVKACQGGKGFYVLNIDRWSKPLKAGSEMHLAHTAHRALTKLLGATHKRGIILTSETWSPERSWVVCSGALPTTPFSLLSIGQVHLTKGRKVQKGVRHPKETPQTLWTNSQAVVTVTLCVLIIIRADLTEKRKTSNVHCQ